MDTLAHGLWGGLPFYPMGRRKLAAAFVLGTAPDLLSFGIFHVSRPDWIMARLAGELSGPPPIEMIPAVVFHAYNLTHSLLVWAALFALVWAVLRHPPWPLLAWGLHILFDIPTHGTDYFPTPYLWPLPTPYVEGISWATPWFLAANYATLAAAYALMFACLRTFRSS